MFYAMEQGELFTIMNIVTPHNVGLKATKKQKAIQRGRIKTFSKASRKRLMKTIAKMKKNNLIFVTLTYKENMQDNQKAKSDLDNMSRHLKRKFPSAWFIWKLEYQKRGAIHYHLLVGGISYKKIYMFLAKYWKHGFYKCEKCNKDIVIYFCKYLSKNEETIHESGRFWGLYNKMAIDFCKLKPYNICNELDSFLHSYMRNRNLINMNCKIEIIT